MSKSFPRVAPDPILAARVINVVRAPPGMKFFPSETLYDFLEKSMGVLPEWVVRPATMESAR